MSVPVRTGIPAAHLHAIFRDIYKDNNTSHLLLSAETMLQLT
jgi:hypothetical protein